MGEVAAGSRAGGGGGEVAAGTLGGAGVGLVVELSEESAVGGYDNGGCEGIALCMCYSKQTH
jgi:hypothetical protein